MQNQQIDIEAWRDLLLRRELEAISQVSAMRALMARVQELEGQSKENGQGGE
jgi:hypothetical protein